MKAPQISLSGTGVLAIGAIVAGAALAYVVYRKVAGAGGLIETAGQAINQAQAEVVGAWRQLTGPVASGGDATRGALYGQQGYAGIDPVTGEVFEPTGQWWGNEEARRYEYESRAEYERLKRPVPVVGPNGAAFGVYPKP